MTDQPQPQKPKASAPPLWCSTRMSFFILCLFATLNFVLQRANINFALVCMVKSTGPKMHTSDIFNLTTITSEESLGILENDSYLDSPFESSLQDYSDKSKPESDEDDLSCKSDTSSIKTSLIEGEFEWDKGVQANILGSFFYGFILTQILGGWVSDKFGGRKAFIASVAVLSILTILNPIAAMQGPEYLFIARAVQGISQGASMPLVNVLSARWAGGSERAFLMGIAYGGFSLAAFITNPLCAFVCKTFGWSYIFYVTGSIGIIWSIAACFIIYDWPEDHPRISTQELEYLKTNRAVQRGEGSRKKLKVPWLKIIFSGPANVVHVTHFCALWSFNTVGMYLPVFMKEILLMDINKNGLYSAFPFLGMLILHLWSGSFFDNLRKRELCRLTNLRKIFNTIGLVLPGISIAFIGLLSCTNNLVGILAISAGHAFIEFAMMGGYFFSIFELAPRFSGILTGITNTLGVLTGFICPAVVGYLTRNGTRGEWLIVFYLAAGFNIFGALVYLVFGSSELQSWAEPPPREKETEFKMLQEKLIVPNGNNKIQENETKILMQ